MRQTSLETIKYMWRNAKNRLFMVILTLLMLIYVFLFAPDFNQQFDVDMNSLENELVGNITQAQHAKEEGWLEPSIMTSTTTYHEQTQAYGRQRALYTTLKQGDIYRYLDNHFAGGEPQDEEIGVKSLFYSLFGIDPIYHKQQRYVNEVENLNFHIVHEITSLQQLHLFFLGAGPLILLTGLAFMISDVHTKDRNLPSQKLGIPLSWQKNLLSQSLAALSFVLGFYIAFFALFYLVNGVLHGFGSFTLPISTSLSTVGDFLLKSVPYILLLMFLFTRLNTLFSLWTKHPLITMTLLIFVIFSANIYIDSYTLAYHPFNFGLLPISYIHFGQIISGGHFLRPIIEGLDVYTSGLIVLGLTIIITELLVYLSSKKMTRQHFMVKG